MWSWDASLRSFVYWHQATTERRISMKNTRFKGMKKATVFALALSCMVTMFGTVGAPAAVHAEETATAEGGRTVLQFIQRW